MTNQAKRPVEIAYTVVGEGDKAKWTEIGAVWASKSGKARTLILKARPLGDRIVLLPPKPAKGGAQ